MSTVKEQIGGAVDGLAEELEQLSHRIHAHPELGYQEVKAAGWLTDFLADSRAFEAAAATPLAREGMLVAAKSMAMTAFDLLADPSLVTKAK